MSTSSLYLTDLLTGLFAALALKHRPVLSLRQNRFDRAMAHLVRDIEQEAAKLNLKVRFRILAHPIYQDSEAVHQALYEAAQSDLISLDNPEFQDIRLKISSADAPRYLSHLPGTPEMYERLATRLLQYYQDAPAPSR